MRRTCVVVALLVACKSGDKSEPQADKKAASKASRADAELVLPKVASRDAVVKVVPTQVRGIVTLDARGAMTVARTTSDWRTEPVDGKPATLEDLRFELEKVEPAYEGAQFEERRVARDDPPPPPDEVDDGDEVTGGSGTAMALEEGKMGKKDSNRAEGQYNMKRNDADPPPRRATRESLELAYEQGHVVAVPVGELMLRPLVLAHPDAPGLALAKVLVAMHGGAIAVAVDGKPDVLRIGFDGGAIARLGISRVEVLLEKSTVKAIADEAVVLWDKPFDATGFAKALGDRRNIAVLVGEGVTVQRVLDVAVALADKNFALGPMTGTLAAREAALGKDAASTTGGMRGRRAAVPTVAVGQPQANGDLDKSIIRRYIMRNKQRIQYCYEKVLLAKPTLRGTVETTFTIGAAGAVTASNASGVDPEVASCVADVIRTIQFPAPKSGGTVQVNYPFIFHIAGD